MITVIDLTKNFGSSRALGRISFSVKAGERIILNGPNGSGKSTLFACLTGLLRADSGEVRYELGSPGPVSIRQARRQIGFVSAKSLLYGDLTVEEGLQLICDMAGVPSGELQTALSDFSLYEFQKKRIRECSQGIVQRVAILRAMLPKPKLLFLDEPFSWLDAESRERCRTLLDDFHRQGGTSILASHEQSTKTGESLRTITLEHGKLVESS